jgi:hypothetical protein
MYESTDGVGKKALGLLGQSIYPPHERFGTAGLSDQGETI